MERRRERAKDKLCPVSACNVLYMRPCLQTDGSRTPSTSCLFIWWKSGWGQRETWGGVLHGRSPPPPPLLPTCAAESYLCSSSRPRRPQSRQHRNRRCRFSSWRSRSGTGARGRLTGALRGGKQERQSELEGKGHERGCVVWEITFWFGKLLFFFFFSPCRGPFQSPPLPCHLITSLDKRFFCHVEMKVVWSYGKLFGEKKL